MIINEITSYPLFKKGQQLKSSSLTGIVKYAGLEDQDTRVYLEGSGIFYGLNISVEPEAGIVKLQPGTAVTSDGLLFALEKEVTYDGISKKDGKDYEIELFERQVSIKVLNNTNENHDELIFRLTGTDPQNSENQDNTAYLIVLIVLSDESTVPSCLYGYENNESKQADKVQVALIPKNFFSDEELARWFIGGTAETGAGDNDPFVHRFGYTEKEEGGPHISFKRFTDLTTFNEGFQDVCKAAEPVIGDACKAVYELVKDKLGMETDNPFEELTSDLQGLHSRVKSDGGRKYPWLYDYYRDLVAAYQEFVSTDLFSYLSLIPWKQRFPAYVSLGSIRVGEDALPYRMGLYRPPFTDLSLNALERPRLLMERLKYLADVAHTRFDTGFPGAGVNFTPDAGVNKQLSERAIPFYYNNPSELSQSWNAVLTRNHRTFDIPGVTELKDRKFLVTNADSYHFYRIKGHTGDNIDVTQTAIEHLRKDLHLPFDLKFVYLGQDSDMDPLIRQRSASFSDLTILLEKIVNDIRCARTCSDTFEESLFGGRKFDRDEIGSMFEALVTLFEKPPVDLEEKLDEICSGEEGCRDEDKTCCKAHVTSLYAVYKEYAGRKKELLDGLLFNRFAEKHPGLEHNGGVPKGGTLVLVCAKNNVDSLSEEKKSNLVKLLLSNNEAEKAAAMHLAKELEGYNIIADFSLPYICCSDKPSINLVLQDAPPVARFDITEQEELPEGEGVKISLKNQSLRADMYHWELYDFKGEFVTDETTTDINKEVKFDLKREIGVVFAVLLTASREGMESKFSREIVICPKGEVVITSNGKDQVDWDITDSNELEIEVTPYGGEFELFLQQNDNQEEIDPSGFDIDWKDDRENAVLTVHEPQAGIYFLQYKFKNIEGCEGAGATLTISAITPTQQPVPKDTDANTGKAVANSEAVLNKRILSYRSDVNKMAKEDDSLQDDNRWADTKNFLLASGAPEVLHAGYEKLQSTLQTGFSKLKAAQKAQVVRMLVYATAYYIDRLVVASPDKIPSIARKLVKAAAESISAQKDGLAQWQQVWETTGLVTAENEKTVNTYKGLIA